MSNEKLAEQLAIIIIHNLPFVQQVGLEPTITEL